MEKLAKQNFVVCWWRLKQRNRFYFKQISTIMPLPITDIVTFGPIPAPGGGAPAPNRVLPAILPDYQRLYEWKEKTSERLLHDIVAHICINDQTDPHNLLNPFYCGNILSHTVAGNEKPIVDGQQRLTTLTLMAVELREFCFKNEFYDLAFKIDKNLIWNENAGGYDQGTAWLKPRDVAALPANLNPIKMMQYVCHIDYEIDEFCLVSAGGGAAQGAGVAIDIEDSAGNQVTLPWKLREGLKINFDNGAELEISHSQNQGAITAILQGTLRGEDLVGGEVAKLKLGKKDARGVVIPRSNGAFNKVRVCLHRCISDYVCFPAPAAGQGPAEVAWIAGDGADSAAQSAAAVAAHGAGDEIGEVPWIGVPNPPGHMDTPYNRANQLYLALRNLRFSITEFPTAGSALSHFMIVNGPGRQETLTTFDLMRAQSLEIIDAEPVSPRGVNGDLVAGTNDYDLNQKWETIRDLFYSISNPDNFFYPYFLSKDIWRGGQNRYGKEEGFEALENILYIPSWNPAGVGWDKQEIIDYYDEIIAAFAYYKEATVLPWGVAPPAHKREWEFLLTTLNAQSKIKQWIPIYMAAREKFSGAHLNPNHTRARIVILLKHLNYLIARTFVLPSLNVNFTAPESNEVYALVRPLIQDIRALPDDPTIAQVDAVLDDIKQRIRDFFQPIHIYEDPAKAAMVRPVIAPHPNFANHELICKNPQARFILMHIERNLGGGAMPGGRLIKGSEMDVEHVLSNTPPDPFAAVAGFNFNQVGWSRHNQRLGNRILLAKNFNNHYSNTSTWDFKKNGDPVDCMPPNSRCNLQKHYSSAAAIADPNVNEFMIRFGASADWNAMHIQTWEEWIMEKFIEAVPPI